MEKMVWEKPEMNDIAFGASEYVAACGDSGKTYKFTCDAGNKESGYVWLETNGTSSLQSGKYNYGSSYWPDYSPSDGNGKDDFLGGYHACGTKHEASSDDAFLSGYYLDKDYWNEEDGTFDASKLVSVIVWRGPNNNNIHCTTNLDIDSWETGKS